MFLKVHAEEPLDTKTSMKNTSEDQHVRLNCLEHTISLLIPWCSTLIFSGLTQSHQAQMFFYFLLPCTLFFTNQSKKRFWECLAGVMLVPFTCSRRYQCTGCGLWQWQTHVGNESGCFLEWKEGPRAPETLWWQCHCQCASSSATAREKGEMEIKLDKRWTQSG